MLESCGCSTACCADERLNEYFIQDWVETAVGLVPTVMTDWGIKERVGSWKARWGLNRMNYMVDPGIYGVGQPTAESPVFVSANYKMSFDHLRRNLKNLHAWILVLDTKGINVWCAAGKGTFGTAELIKRIQEHNLAGLVNHNKIIVPQLGAVGVAAHEVLKVTRFKVVYGPVWAKDIPAFKENNMKATDDMRTIEFPIKDRLVLTPMELVPGFKIFAYIVLVLSLLQLAFTQTLTVAFFVSLLPYLGGLIVGSFIVPLFLPFVPFRSFALKGALAGLAFILIYHYYSHPQLLQRIAQLLVVPAMSSYLAVNFTGTTTFTSLSGVKKELKWGIPLYITAAVAGLVLYIVGLFV